MPAHSGGLKALSRDTLEPAGLAVTELAAEPEAAGYEGAVVRIGSRQLRVRSARITPKKNGLFVAIWIRRADGTSGPVPHDDASDGLLILVAEGQERGAFLIPAVAPLGLRELADGTGGKRGFRLYPPWTTPESPQAARSQRAQVPYFVPQGPLSAAHHAWFLGEPSGSTSRAE